MPESSQISMILFRCPSIALTLSRIVIALFFSNTLWGANWLPITEEENASTECPFDSDAGAEVLYKSLELDDEDPTNSYRHYYLRIKIYDEKGAESVGI